MGLSTDIGKYRFIFKISVSVYIDIGKVEGIGIEYFIPIPMPCYKVIDKYQYMQKY